MFDSIFRRRDDESKMKEEGRMPPGQSLTQRFPVLHYGPQNSVAMRCSRARMLMVFIQPTQRQTPMLTAMSISPTMKQLAAI